MRNDGTSTGRAWETATAVDAAALHARAAGIMREAPAETPDALRALAGLLDLTTLEGADTAGRVRQLCARARVPGDGCPPTAAVCVYPVFAAIARDALRGSAVRTAVVATQFPSGHAPRAARIDEVRRTVADGAEEVDVVLPRGLFLEGRDHDVRDDLEGLVDACGAATLKLILETGELGSPATVLRAARLGLDAGVPFLKTSTGKIQPAATPAVTLLLARAIREHAWRTGAEVGLKPAGGIRTAREALGLVHLVRETLGDAWIRPERLRIGASTLLVDIQLRLRHHTLGVWPAERALPTG